MLPPVQQSYFGGISLGSSVLLFLFGFCVALATNSGSFLSLSSKCWDYMHLLYTQPTKALCMHICEAKGSLAHALVHLTVAHE